MKDSTTESRFEKDTDTWSVLENILREGAQRMLIQAIENEVDEFIEKHSLKVDENGHRIVVRNGHLPERVIVSGLGPFSVKRPRVDDRKLDPEKDERVSSTILPRYLRKIPSVDNLIPVLYLKGISTNGFQEALASILGEGAKGLSAANIVRLKKSWEDDFLAWTRRDLSGRKYAYIWADGIHFNVRLDSERSCILVIMGADSDGNKELLAVSDGYRESADSWTEMLLGLKKQGIEVDPKLAIGDGALGFWKALDKVFPETKRQRCWVHKTANILDKMPKSVQSKAKSLIHEMYMAETEENALKAYDHFVSSFQDKYPKAVGCLTKDKEDLFTFYSFPGVHWIHIRTTNPIESTFATVRLRTKRTKGCGSRTATLSMVWKLCCEAEKTWKKLKGYKLIPKVLQGVFCKDGVLEDAA
ncbi:MAG: IS256 family transposase [Spirochaetaceae bacterium]|nr:IS256 family transposase [Spirochaetaceae bacterium]